MPFIYYGQGVADWYDDFLERLVSHLALEGTEITDEKRNDQTATMGVKRTGEQGTLLVMPSGKDVKVTYTVIREKKEVARGLMGGLVGAGVGSVLGGILRRDDGSITDALGGAAAGGAYEAYHGYEESREDRTAFAALVAEKVKEVEDEIWEIKNAQAEAQEANRERARERRAEVEAEEDEIRTELEEISGDLLTLSEEIDLLEEDGQKGKGRKVRARADRAERLFAEAEEACDTGEYRTARSKIRAARSMIEGAMATLDDE
ncbi:hypothetical protein E2N92_10120 [Methanofollis formosanus]|uniref:Uncharacterized protein n=1 Tax=Methanofollis formosanus TaxID=299308 RepID=A0A8G1A3H2_9EURY|nr:hypothetical protein [Methanofollis formosanus]QYZ79758.1 hypothetical protein E2N92_10120 [Methanofollis formosanus]